MNNVAFDIGGVLGRVDLTRFRNLLIDFGFSEHFCDYFQGFHDIGLCSLRQALINMSSRRYTPDVYRALERTWIETLAVSEPMLKLVEELLDDGWHVYLLSNVGVDHARHLRDFPVLNRCTQHFSFEVGARKPSKLFYQSFHHSEGWRGIWRYNNGQGAKIESYTPFFDDRKENVLAAKDYFHGVQFSLDYFKDDKEAADAVREYLNNPSLEPSWKDICTG